MALFRCGADAEIVAPGTVIYSYVGPQNTFLTTNISYTSGTEVTLPQSYYGMSFIIPKCSNFKMTRTSAQGAVVLGGVKNGVTTKIDSGDHFDVDLSAYDYVIATGIGTQALDFKITITD